MLALQRHLVNPDINAKQGALIIQLHNFLLTSSFFLSNSNSDVWRSKTHFSLDRSVCGLVIGCVLSSCEEADSHKTFQMSSLDVASSKSWLESI